MKTVLGGMQALLVAHAVLPLSVATAADTVPDPLASTIAALDEAVFDAFNRCDDPAELARHAGYFADDVEFYHDTGGVTWNREAMLENTRRYVCGRFRRERVPGTLRVFPIRDYGAIAQGVHRFCQLDTGRCDGEAEFTILWRQEGERWRITRVMSYGHRPAPGGE